MRPRPVIVATVRDAAEVLGSFISYHLAIGFAHIYLFFDDPADPFADTLAGHPDVTAMRSDQALRAQWTTLRSYARYRGHIESEVMARQILNCELAIRKAAEAGFDWILHIDSDELFLCAGDSAPELFEALDFRGARNAAYMNLEALPEQLQIGDYFREVTLFKVNIRLQGSFRFDQQQLELIRSTHFADGYVSFHLYDNGKSAARIDENLVPLSVHEFGRVLPDGSIDQSRQICGDSQVILHYPNCGLSKFVSKYQALGSFADKWFGTMEVFPFHKEARDVVAQGDAAAIERLYRDRVMRNAADDVPLLMENGILRRIDGPANLLGKIALRS